MFPKQTLRGSHNVGVVVRGSVHGRARSFLLLFTLLGDPTLQKHTMKLTNSRNFCIFVERCSTFGAPAWPGPPGWPGPRLKWAKDRFASKNDEKVKVLRMSLPIVESLSGPQESIFSLFRGAQLHSGKKFKN